MLTSQEITSLIKTLKTRFEKNNHRHATIKWVEVEQKLLKNPAKLWSINEMEKSGGEPDVVLYDEKTNQYIFIDCATESPKGRRSLCYDKTALDSRKEYKPANNVVDVACQMGIELLTEEQYFELQKIEPFDTKTSSWLKTPDKIRDLGGAIFGDFRFGRVFIYHNGAESYYAARGFRGMLRL